MQAKWIGAAAALAVLVGGAAHAGTLRFEATLKGSSETPPNATTGTGHLAATLDTTSRMFTYKVSYSGLTGAVTMAHFHKGAVGVSGPPVLPVPKSALGDPIGGEATLTAAQVSDLEAGKWYFNIHTAAHPGGEVRGQVEEVR